MSDYDNKNTGVLFPNDKKTKPNQPALRGQLNIAGTEYWASAWRKISSETNKPYISLALQEKDVEDAPNINGELHQEDRKSDKAPAFKGHITLTEEVELPLAAWIKVRAATGTSFFSLKIEEVRAGAGGDKIDDDDIFFGMGSAMETTPEIPEEFDDDIPF